MSDTINNENALNGEDESMSEEERAMLAALEGDDSAVESVKAEKDKARETPAPTPRTVNPVDIEPLKASTPGTSDPERNLKLIVDLPVEIKVEIGNSRLTIQEVLNLAPGAILELDRPAGSPADIMVNGTCVGHGDVVVVDESYGIRITRLVDSQERINSL